MAFKPALSKFIDFQDPDGNRLMLNQAIERG